MTIHSKIGIGMVLVVMCLSMPAASADELEDAMAKYKDVVAGGIEEPPRMVRAEGWEWEHEVRVWLPGTYNTSDRTYPTLWVTDNALEFVQVALMGAEFGMAPELIVVAVGQPRGTSVLDFQRRRSYDFIPDKSLMGPMFASLPDGTVGGAPGFLDFLVNQLRPMLAEEYRMDLNDQGLAGHSGGAQFGLYVLFNKPESFNKYIISSPAVYQPWLDMEERWHEQHKDLEAEVFVSAGEDEVVSAAAAQIASAAVLVAERLATRSYPSLELHFRMFPGENHLTVMPIAYSHAIRALWGD